MPMKRSTLARAGVPHMPDPLSHQHLHVRFVKLNDVDLAGAERVHVVSHRAIISAV